MKDTHVLCVVGIIGLLTITAVFIGYATNTLPHYKQRVITTSPPTVDTIQATSTPTTELSPNTLVEKKKTCDCCKKRLEKLREHLEKLGEQKKSTKNVKNTAE